MSHKIFNCACGFFVYGEPDDGFDDDIRADIDDHIEHCELNEEDEDNLTMNLDPKAGTDRLAEFMDEAAQTAAIYLAVKAVEALEAEDLTSAHMFASLATEARTVKPNVVTVSITPDEDTIQSLRDKLTQPVERDVL